MKTTRYSTILFSLLLYFSLPAVTNAQMDNLNFMYGPVGDARILLEQYLQPYTDIVGANLNGGWYHTAATHKIGGLDVTAMIGIAFAPSEAMQYDISALTGLSGTVASPVMAPTSMGNLADRPELVYTTQIVNGADELETHELLRFIHPNGGQRDFVPLPMAQISIGLPAGTDITARYVPSIDIGFGSETGVWGVGGKHSVSQWIPIIKKLKFIDIAVQGGYTKVTSSIHQALPSISTIDPFPDYNWDDQFLVMNVSGWTVNLIASQTLPIITIYEGIGYAGASAQVSMMGHYPVNDVIRDPLSPDFGTTTYTIDENPIEDMEIVGKRGIRINAGVRFKLGVFTLNYDFTRTRFTTHTAGIGFTFR